MTPDQRLMATAAGWLLGVLLLFGAGLGLGYEWRDRAARAEIAELTAERATERENSAETARLAERSYRQREAQMAQDHQEITHAAKTEAVAARADADRVRLALDRLRKQRAAACGGGAAADPASSRLGPPADAADTLPADMLLRIAEAAGELARHADEARIAGRACERAYKAVTAPRLGSPGS